MWPFRRKPSEQDRTLAAMIYATWLLDSDARLPSKRLRRWVNRTLERRVFTKDEA